MRTIIRIAALLCALSGLAGAQTQVLCNQGSSKVPCTAPLLNTYPNWASPGTIGSGTATTIRGTTITATTQFTGSGAGLTNVPAASVVGSLSGVTINCASNTCQNIALTSAVTGILPLANGGTNSATGDLVATNFLGTPWLKLSSIASPGTPASGATWIYSTTANGQDQLFVDTSDGVATVLGVGNAIVRNTSGAPITKGEAVYVTGATGNVPNVTLARSNAVASAAAYCIALTSIADNAYGRCMRTGVITGVDTSAFTSGDVLWVSSSVAGALQNTDPVWPNYSSHVGYVLTSGVGNGSIAVDASPDYTGNETGTTSASWTVGPGSGASAASVKFANANTGTLSWTPTGTRTLTLPDTTSSLVASNDTRLPPAPTAANKLVYDTGTGYAETAACGTAGYILEGGSPPACTQSPTVGTKLTVPRIDSTGSLILNGATGGNVQHSVDSTTVLTVEAAGITAAQPLAMSSKKITGLAPATTSGDALSYPWVTANASTAVATTTSLADTSGTYTDVTGATLSLAAGTHIVSATLRAEIGATTGAGAFVTCRLHDGTNPISNTETLITQTNQLLVLEQNTTTLVWPITVGSTTSVKAQCARTFSGILFTSDIPSDSNGRTRMFSVQTAP